MPSQGCRKSTFSFAVKTDATRQSNLNTARKAARKIKQEKDTEEQKQIMEHAAEHH